VDSPPERSLLVLGYPDAYEAADHVTEIMEHRPLALEGFDGRLVEDMRRKGMHLDSIAMLPEGGGWLLVEFGADTRQEADERARALLEDLKKQTHAPTMELLSDPAQQKMIWQVRESGVGASSAVPDAPFTWPSWEDTAVPPEKLGGYLRAFRALLNKYGYIGAFFGHFGQGCIHVRVSFDLRTAEGIKQFRSFIHEGADLVLRYGGTLSGEHGDGQAHGELLPRMYGHELMTVGVGAGGVACWKIGLPSDRTCRRASLLTTIAIAV
jgi:FAD/FMN-containing dehydrogenase